MSLEIRVHSSDLPPTCPAWQLWGKPPSLGEALLNRGLQADDYVIMISKKHGQVLDQFHLGVFLPIKW